MYNIYMIHIYEDIGVGQCIKSLSLYNPFFESSSTI